MRSSAPRRVDFSRAAPRAAPRQRGTRHSCRCLQTAAMTAASCRAELSTTPSGLRPGSTSSCSLATWHVALMLVPPDGCDDNDVFDCGARHHGERFSTGAAPHASPRRGMRHPLHQLLLFSATDPLRHSPRVCGHWSYIQPGDYGYAFFLERLACCWCARTVIKLSSTLGLNSPAPVKACQEFKL